MSTSSINKTTSVSSAPLACGVLNQRAQTQNGDCFRRSFTYPASSATFSAPSIDVSAFSSSVPCTLQTARHPFASKRVTQVESYSPDSSSFSSSSSSSSSSLMASLKSWQVRQSDSISSTTTTPSSSSSPLFHYRSHPLRTDALSRIDSSVSSQPKTLPSSSNEFPKDCSQSSSEINLKKRKASEPDRGNPKILRQRPSTYPSRQQTDLSAQIVADYVRKVVEKMVDIRQKVERMDGEISFLRKERVEHCKHYDELRRTIHEISGFQNVTLPPLVTHENMLIESIENYLLKIQTILGRLKQAT